MSHEETIRAVVFQEDRMWIAQCLEYDIAVQADGVEELRRRLYGTLQAELQASIDDGDKPFGGIGPAPDRFFQLWEKCSTSLKLDDAPTIKKDHSKIDVDLKLCA
jgi:hypothetical protein